MDTQSQAMFDELVAMDQEVLNDEQKGFLMARRGYFNDEQRKRYADMIKAHEAGKLFAPKVEDEADLETLSVKKLQAIAKAEGVDVKKLTTAKEIAKAIKASREEE
jgi:hypothetical protein